MLRRLDRGSQAAESSRSAARPVLLASLRTDAGPFVAAVTRQPKLARAPTARWHQAQGPRSSRRRRLPLRTAVTRARMASLGTTWDAHVASAHNLRSSSRNSTARWHTSPRSVRQTSRSQRRTELKSTEARSTSSPERIKGSMHEPRTRKDSPPLHRAPAVSSASTTAPERNPSTAVFTVGTARTVGEGGCRTEGEARAPRGASPAAARTAVEKVAARPPSSAHSPVPFWSMLLDYGREGYRAHQNIGSEEMWPPDASEEVLSCQSGSARPRPRLRNRPLPSICYEMPTGGLATPASPLTVGFNPGGPCRWRRDPV